MPSATRSTPDPALVPPPRPVVAKLCRVASAEMLRPYRHLPCLVNRYRAPPGATVAQAFECIRVIRNPPPPATEFFMLFHGPPTDPDDEDQRPSFVSVNVYATAAAVAHSVSGSGWAAAVTAVMDIPTARVWIGAVGNIPASYLAPRGAADFYDGHRVPTSLVGGAGVPHRSPIEADARGASASDVESTTAAAASTTPSAAESCVRDDFDDAAEASSCWAYAPSGESVKHYRGPPRDPFSRRYWGDGRGVPLWVDADAPRPFGVLLAAECHSYGGERLIAPLTNNAAERQWQALDAKSIYPSVDSLLHGARGAARPRFAYQHQPWAPVAESTVAAALRDYVRTLASSSRTTSSTPGAASRQMQLQLEPRAAGKGAQQSRIASASSTAGASMPLPTTESAASPFSFEVDAAAIRTAVDYVLKIGARVENAHPSASSTAAAQCKPEGGSVGNERAKFCASVGFFSLAAPMTPKAPSDPRVKPPRSQMRRCFLSQRKFGGFVPCAGECVVVEHRHPPGDETPSTATAAATSDLEPAIGVIRSVSSWSRRKSGGASLTTVCRGATIADVARQFDAAAAAAAAAVLTPLPKETVGRLVVAASGDDVRRPYVTGRAWTAPPTALDVGAAAFVELSHGFPTEALSRERALQQVREVVASLVPGVAADCVCFVVPPNANVYPRHRIKQAI